MGSLLLIMDALTQEQISEFKEAFNMFADGTDSITRESLQNCMKQLGFRPSADDLTSMFQDACDGGRKISFSEFVSMMGEKMHSVDDAKTISNAFESFDANVTGYISHDQFRKILGMGKSKFSDKEVRDFIKMGDAGEGKIDYVTLSREIGGA